MVSCPWVENAPVIPVLPANISDPWYALRRDFAVGVHVIEIGPVFGDDHLKWPPAPRGWKIQHLGEEYRRGLAVVSRQDRVVEMDGHVASPESSRSFSRSVAHLFGYSVVAPKERLDSSDYIIVVVYLPDQTPFVKIVNGCDGLSATMSPTFMPRSIGTFTVMCWSLVIFAVDPWRQRTNSGDTRRRHLLLRSKKHSSM